MQHFLKNLDTFRLEATQTLQNDYKRAADMTAESPPQCVKCDKVCDIPYTRERMCGTPFVCRRGSWRFYYGRTGAHILCSFHYIKIKSLPGTHTGWMQSHARAQIVCHYSFLWLLTFNSGSCTSRIQRHSAALWSLSVLHDSRWSCTFRPHGVLVAHLPSTGRI